jgi:ABC-type ATPase with predicted acetyltransferase domain
MPQWLIDLFRVLFVAAVEWLCPKCGQSKIARKQPTCPRCHQLMQRAPTKPVRPG